MDVEKMDKEWLNKFPDHLKEYWISSNVFPFVSGTQIATNATVSAHMAAYIVKVPVGNRYTLTQLQLIQQYPILDANSSAGCEC